jgi:DNA glycosylase AlkZ-like
MTNSDIARLRLLNQQIAGSRLTKPEEVVSWLGAVQAQDYGGALWAIGLRLRGCGETDIERALASRKIIRTWPMRRTLHFVPAADARWMLRLLTPRVVAASAQRAEQWLGLDEAVFTRSKKLLERALSGGKQLTRARMYEVLEAGRISSGDGRGMHILCRLAQDGLICFSAREGKQPTFALLEEWIPAAKLLTREEALAKLAGRYFTSHGPATLQDFVWWTGLLTSDARAALEMAKPQLVEESIAGQKYWLAANSLTAKDELPPAHLLPSFDEYMVAYKDRSAVLNPVHTKLHNSGNGIFNPTMIMHGRVVGTWKRALKKDALVVTLSPFAKLKQAETRAFIPAANRYGKFLGASISTLQLH